MTFKTFATAVFAIFLASSAFGQDAGNHEVWAIDQSNSYDTNADGTPDAGGRLYIVQGSALAGKAAATADAEVIDLGGDIAEWIRTETGSYPVRPHYIAFNASATHAIISFVATGHVLIIEAATRQPVFVVDVGAQAHAAVPSPDESYILVANQNGKRVQRINTDYGAGTFALDAAAELNLAVGTTPSGAAVEGSGRLDNAPILALPSLDSTLAFVTLRGGGLFVVDPKAAPIAIVAEYTDATIEPAGLLAIQSGNTLFFNSGAGGGAALARQSVLYSLPVDAFSTTPLLTPDQPAPFTIFDDVIADAAVDSHGPMLTKGGRYLWVADRAANSVVVVDTTTQAVVNRIALEGAVSDDPTPDIFALAPAGNRAYVALRGPNPLTGNNPETHNAEGTTPGIGVIRVEASGLRGTLQAIFPISNVVADVERADPHGIAVRATN